MNTIQQTAVINEKAHSNIKRRTAITASNLVQYAGVAAMLAGILFIVIQAIHPSDVVASVNTGRWATVHNLGVVMCILGLFGMTGIYAGQAEQAGWMGLAGYVLLSLFYALTLAYQFVEAMVVPPLVAESPIFVEGLLGIPSGQAVDIHLGNLESLYAATGVMYLLGGLLLGIATFRAGVLSRWAAGLLAVGTLLPLPLSSLIHHPYDRVLAVPVAAALVWLGWSVWTNRREHA